MYLTCILALVGVRPEYIQDTRDTLTLLWYSCIPRPFGRPSYDTYRYTPDTHPIHIHTTVTRPGHRYIHPWTFTIHTRYTSSIHMYATAVPFQGFSKRAPRARIRARYITIHIGYTEYALVSMCGPHGQGSLQALLAQPDGLLLLVITGVRLTRRTTALHNR